MLLRPVTAAIAGDRGDRVKVAGQVRGQVTGVRCGTVDEA
jgi:hypothetical protein